jgi:osmotically-inducible protein OsmY
MSSPRSLFLMSAISTAAMLTGCSTVDTFRKCGVAGCPGDAGISAKVESQFDLYTALQPPNLIRVQTFDRVVYLTGIVNTTLVRDLAGSVAAQVPGVPHVINSISIDYQGK